MKNHFFFDGKAINNLRPIAFCVYINGKLIKKRTGIFLDEKYWNQETQRVKKSFPEEKKVNEKIQKIEIEYEALIKSKGIDEITNNDITKIIKAIRQNRTAQQFENNSHLLSSWMERYKDEISTSESAKEAYKYTRQSLLQFEKYSNEEITFSMLEKDSQSIRNKFVDFLKKDISINGKLKRANKAGSIVNKIEKINTVINYFNQETKNNIKRFKANNKNKDNKINSKDIIHLDKNEITILYNLLIEDELNINRNEKILLAKFLFRCFCGLRFSEMKQLTSNHFNGDTIDYISIKTKEKVKIPLFEQAKKLAEFVNYKWEKWNNNNQLNVLRQQESVVVRKVVTSYLNQRNIYEYDYDSSTTITHKLSEKISTHSARKSFGTLIYKHTNNIYTASKYLNHKNVEDTVKYLGINEDNLRDEIIDLKIGETPVIEDLKNNKDESFTPIEVDDLLTILIFSNITLQYITSISNFIGYKDTEFLIEYDIDYKYKVTGKVMVEANRLGADKLVIADSSYLIDKDSKK